MKSDEILTSISSLKEGSVLQPAGISQHTEDREVITTMSFCALKNICYTDMRKDRWKSHLSFVLITSELYSTDKLGGIILTETWSSPHSAGSMWNLPLELPFTLNGAFWKRSAANRRNSKTLALRLSVDGKHFENGAVKNDGITIILWFPCPNFPLTQIQNDRWF